MDCISNDKGGELSLISNKLKKNVSKDTFVTLILEAVDEFKKADYKRGEVRNYFYNVVFETVFSIEEDNFYVSEYIDYFKNNVPFDLKHFETEVKNMKNSVISEQGTWENAKGISSRRRNCNAGRNQKQYCVGE